VVKKVIGLLVALAIFGAVISTSGQADCHTPSGQSRFGVVEPLGWKGLYPRESMVRALDSMAQAGIGWVRLNWTWKDMQPQEGPFDYSQYDMIVTLATEREIEVLPILFAVPAWASTAPPELIAERGNLSPVDRYRPRDMNTWLTYVRNVVERYDGDGLEDAPGSPRLRYWEVWNEPNIALFWPPEPTVNEYVSLLIATHEAILAADPAAKVVLGGMAGTGINPGGGGFLHDIYDAGAASYFDVVSIHHYSHPMFGAAPLQAAVESVRILMNSYGDAATPLWLTEIGWSDAPNAWDAPTASQESIASFLTAVYTTPLDVEVIFWYNFRDIFAESPDVEHNFGLLEGDFSPKPAFEAYTQLTRNCD
jgi:hypothetical protein